MKKQVRNSIYSGMEDVDRSCVHVVAVIGLILGGLAYIIYPPGIFDVPFAELTAVPVLRLSGSVILGMLAILIFIDVLKVFIKR